MQSSAVLEQIISNHLQERQPQKLYKLCKQSPCTVHDTWYQYRGTTR